jgi:hypothetical protein
VFRVSIAVVRQIGLRNKAPHATRVRTARIKNFAGGWKPPLRVLKYALVEIAVVAAKLPHPLEISGSATRCTACTCQLFNRVAR